jgi:hypothetical protein
MDFFAIFLIGGKGGDPGWKEEKLTDLDLPVWFLRILKAFTGR